MRGPYERLKYDFRRGWECPVCHRKEKTDFLVTSRFCTCKQKKENGALVSMRLADDGVRRVWTHPNMLAAQQARAERLARGEVATDLANEVETPSVTEVPTIVATEAPAEVASEIVKDVESAATQESLPPDSQGAE